MHKIRILRDGELLFEINKEPLLLKNFGIVSCNKKPIRVFYNNIPYNIKSYNENSELESTDILVF